MRVQVGSRIGQNPQLSEWQVRDALLVVFGIGCHGDQRQIVDALTDRRRHLGRVDHSREWYRAPLTIRGFSQEVLILCEQGTPERHGTIQQRIIVPSCRAILLSGQDIDPSQS